MTQLVIEIPDELISQVADRGDKIEDIVLAALEDYLAKDNCDLTKFDITKTTTWELCGKYTVKAPEQEYIVGTDEQGNPITNYKDSSF